MVGKTPPPKSDKPSSNQPGKPAASGKPDPKKGK